MSNIPSLARPPVVGAVFCVLGLFACGSTDTKTPVVVDSGAGVQDSGPVPTDAPSDWDGGLPELSGEWALLEVQAGVAAAPGGAPIDTVTSAISRATFKQQGLEIDVKSVHCAIDVVTKNPLVTSIIPDAFIKSLGTISRPSRLTKTATGYSFHQDKAISLRGAKLANPDTDPLPTSASDPAVFDQDGDNNPGMTILLTGVANGGLYVAQRDWSVFDGVISSLARVDGINSWGVEQVKLGAEPGVDALVKSAPAPTPQADASLSYFRYTRLTESMDCAAIVAAKDRLFQR